MRSYNFGNFAVIFIRNFLLLGHNILGYSGVDRTPAYNFVGFFLVPSQPLVVGSIVGA